MALTKETKIIKTTIVGDYRLSLNKEEWDHNQAVESAIELGLLQ